MILTTGLYFRLQTDTERLYLDTRIRYTRIQDIHMYSYTIQYQ